MKSRRYLDENYRIAGDEVNKGRSGDHLGPFYGLFNEGPRFHRRYPGRGIQR